ncbi:MAG: hypothetical protein ALECFALPRED_002454 [Alectoria fallacina]|uniref:Protein kinase domain-containing protein n=1 Tax=Alectoria fallacina TaxID=1903189 RepID=A0A8H3EJW5_9LECA|nr:MAG: hypothetical protein ALECFALPRED_002454 [Alectoria fallacina]
MDRPQQSLPYEAGKTLTLSINQSPPQDVASTIHLEIEVKIVRFIRPSTLSCVMVVESLAGSGPADDGELSILKLYDWRYATQLRQDHKIDPWTQSHEDAYRGFVENGGAAKFVAALDDDTDETDDRLWDTAHNEAYLFAFSRDLHRSEVRAYAHLKDLQGKSVPRFFASVHVNAFSTKNSLFGVQGILMEFVGGYSLSKLAHEEPESTWQSICDEAIRAINLISDHGVLNEDVKPHNIILRRQATSPAPEVFVIDFAQCRFREDYKSEAEWEHEKSVQDEEGAMGYVMAHRLRGAVEYKPSHRYRCKCSICTSAE